MANIWDSWVSDQTVDEFLAEVDATVAEGAFPDRRAAFVAYATYVLSELAFARWGPHSPDDGLSAGKLADLLLAHALEVEKQTRREAVFAAN